MSGNDAKAMQVRELRKTNLVTVQGMLEQSRDSIKAGIPRHLTYERLAKVALTEFRTNPKLLECTPQSLMATIVKAGHLGFELGSALGQAYPVPYWNSKLGSYECQLIVGYRGFIALARRSGEIQSITARVVHERDLFELEYGLDEKLKHVPVMDGDPGEPTHVYAVARLMGGGIQYEVLTRGEVLKIKHAALQKLADYMRANSPWTLHEEEMWRKTAVRRLIKYLPVSIEMADAMDADQERPEIDITSVSILEGAESPDDLRREVGGEAARPRPVTQREEERAPASDQRQQQAGDQRPDEKRSEWPKDIGGVWYARSTRPGLKQIPWDERHHAGTKSVTSDGYWTMRKGHDKEAYAAWLDELEATEARMEEARARASERIAAASASNQAVGGQDPHQGAEKSEEEVYVGLMEALDKANTLPEIHAIEVETRVARISAQRKERVLSVAADMRLDLQEIAGGAGQSGGPGADGAEETF